jgi:glycosyltransferase involved in cell wall biosynthesis
MRVSMKLAIVHDFLNQFGGAERVVSYFSKIFPEAPIYTSIYFKNDTFDLFKGKQIYTSFMQKIPKENRTYRLLFFIYPYAFSRFNLGEYEVILSSSSAFAHHVKKSKAARHICYCHTPPRFLWNTDDYLEREKISKPFSLISKPFISYLRKVDKRKSKGVDFYIANSQDTRKKIKRIYNRDSTVINPPIEVDKYIYSKDKQDFYLVVSRLKGYKRIDIAVEAFNKCGKKLVIIGSGEDEPYLKSMAEPNIEFLGRVSESRLIEMYSKAKALILPGAEDFGLTPLEAQASGTSVIAYGKRGALETVKDGETGYFFYELNPDSLIGAIKKFESNSLDCLKCRINAENFDFKNFKQKIIGFLKNVT